MQQVTDGRINQVAALANAALYASHAVRDYVDGAPHIKHGELRQLYGRLVVCVYDFAAARNPVPDVLDLGAGEGSVTLPFLELGARVTAVDLSGAQLDALQARCAQHADRLEVRCQDIFDAIAEAGREGRRYDIIVANSFLHHIPDYLGLIRQAAAILSPHGQFFSFQDPLRHDTVGRFTRAFGTTAYLSWRVFKGDTLGGIRRRLRRSRGIYLEECPQDHAEYHAMRNGVDQAAIAEQLGQLGFECRVLSYFSTQSRIFQRVGSALGLKNTFAVWAKRN